MRARQCTPLTASLHGPGRQRSCQISVTPADFAYTLAGQNDATLRESTGSRPAGRFKKPSAAPTSRSERAGRDAGRVLPSRGASSSIVPGLWAQQWRCPTAAPQDPPSCTHPGVCLTFMTKRMACATTASGSFLALSTRPRRASRIFLHFDMLLAFSASVLKKWLPSKTSFLTHWAW